MDAQALLRKSPDLNVKYHTNRQRTLLLDRFSLISINNDVVERIKRSFRTLFMTKGLFTRIWLYSTWAQLVNQDFGKKRPWYHNKPYNIIETLQYARDLGIPLQDREGVSLNKKEWEEWMRKL
ncbi:hypothetical protein FRC20_007710 [Serendipita sp. 405]|nr:hypothetical protein FRC20_007710 [Serendipita sp. 405]